ncbi:MBL fold metallo-hydrolase [Virgibacillus profundi]|uniref:MBL fold metallo-hydrolase n=1 Tax=Virgibacillus profundi TaxID=2024555 RepID=A0A2A2IH16_9BACI|nr:MBL fold metallo-hydrolase [Virgibacillus profundi]PAV30832.1 MBL fold metallo-hydrolase [Virgibacillus profundi]PXY55015.1 MBL fold metallo-hydrolase [Virgibacillus profundi]
MYKKLLLTMMLAIALVACGQESGQDTTTQRTDEDPESAAVDKNEATEKETTEEKAPTKENADTLKNDALSELQVHYIDAGQADATLFRYKDQDNSYTILYDTGDWRRNKVVNYMADQDISYIDLIIVSHPDADHIGQLAEIVNTYETGEVWLSGNESSSQTFQHAMEAILSSGADFHEPRTGEEFEIGPMDIDVLYPSSISGKSNEESVSLKFTYGNTKFLFTGDAGKSDELQMLSSGIDIQADILQLGHHGSNTSSDPTFIKAVNPAVAIYSAGANNSYGHPHSEVISLIQNSGIDLYGTDVHGTIIVKTDGEDYDILTNKDGTISPKSTGSTNSSREKDEAKSETTETENKAANGSCVNINEASFEEVQEIIHIGPERAQDLIDLRPYDSVDDLDKIKGIGPARIADINSQGLACTGG